MSGDPLAQLHTTLAHATAALLGDTIRLDDDAWRAPSLLPGWSRGHVATHVARNADALVRVVTGALTGSPAPMYDSVEARNLDIEAGAGRGGQELHTDLDTSAAQLDTLLDRVAKEGAWANTLELRDGATVPISLVPSLRLTEIVLHHVDLDCGHRLADLDDATVHAVLELTTQRMSSRLDRPIELVIGANRHRLGPDGPTPVEVRGTSSEVLGWLTGRSTAVPDGADGIELPGY